MLAVSIVAMNEDLSVTEVVTSVTVHAQYNFPPAKRVRMRVAVMTFRGKGESLRLNGDI